MTLTGGSAGRRPVHLADVVLAERAASELDGARVSDRSPLDRAARPSRASQQHDLELTKQAA